MIKINIYNFLKRVKYFILLRFVIFNYNFYKYFRKCSYFEKYTFLDAEQTLNYLLKSEKSFIRFGDGEFNFLYGIETHFQKYDPFLKSILLEIVKNHTPNSSYILGIPILPIEKINYNSLQKKRKLKTWIRTEMFMKNKLSEKCVYGDPFIFRRAAVNEKLNISKLWENKIVLLVGSLTKYFRYRQLEITKKQYLIDCPNNNAFKEWKNIINNILEVIAINNLNKEDIVILISLGPTAKVIAYELSKKDLIVYDIGHHFDLKYRY